MNNNLQIENIFYKTRRMVRLTTITTNNIKMRFKTNERKSLDGRKRDKVRGTQRISFLKKKKIPF